MNKDKYAKTKENNRNKKYTHLRVKRETLAELKEVSTIEKVTTTELADTAIKQFLELRKIIKQNETINKLLSDKTSVIDFLIDFYKEQSKMFGNISNVYDMFKYINDNMDTALNVAKTIDEISKTSEKIALDKNINDLNKKDDEQK
jgi:hypothetical protein